MSYLEVKHLGGWVSFSGLGKGYYLPVNVFELLNHISGLSLELKEPWVPMPRRIPTLRRLVYVPDSNVLVKLNNTAEGMGFRSETRFLLLASLCTQPIASFDYSYIREYFVKSATGGNNVSKVPTRLYLGSEDKAVFRTLDLLNTNKLRFTIDFIGNWYLVERALHWVRGNGVGNITLGTALHGAYRSRYELPSGYKLYSQLGATLPSKETMVYDLLP